MVCQHDPRETWGFDVEDGVYRCALCGAKISDPPKWLVEKCRELVINFETRAAAMKAAGDLDGCQNNSRKR